MERWKLPPREKIYEAFSAIADHRCKILEPGRATMVSSDGSRQYTLKWKVEPTGIFLTSNDNASHWQGYTGYPLIALLILLNKIEIDESIIPGFKNINWYALNKAHKDNYVEAVEAFLSRQTEPGQADKIKIQVESVYNQLLNLPLYKFRNEPDVN